MKEILKKFRVLKLFLKAKVKFLIKSNKIIEFIFDVEIIYN